MAGARQPIKLLEIKGKKHLTKDEKEKRKSTEVNANADNINSPSYLTKKQSIEFMRIATELKDIEIMSNIDCDLLARFIIANDLYTLFTKKMFKKETQEDMVLLEKTSNLQDKYFKQCQATSKELGLTISSRCKLVIPQKPQMGNIDPMADLLKAKRG